MGAQHHCDGASIGKKEGKWLSTTLLVVAD